MAHIGRLTVDGGHAQRVAGDGIGVICKHTMRDISVDRRPNSRICPVRGDCWGSVVRRNEGRNAHLVDCEIWEPRRCDQAVNNARYTYFRISYSKKNGRIVIVHSDSAIFCECPQENTVMKRLNLGRKYTVCIHIYLCTHG